MVQQNSILLVTDKSGVSLVQCVKVLGSSKKRLAVLGDVIVVSIKKLHSKRHALLKPSQQKQFAKGKLHRGLIVRTSFNFCRFPGVYIRFDENSVIIVNKKVVPVSSRIYGPILRELCVKYPSIGSISRYIV